MAQTNYDSDFCGKVPIHLTNLIQPYGVLAVVDTTQFNVIQVSENADKVFGHEPGSIISNPLSAYNSHLAARVVEAERDYVPPNYAIYKIVQRPPSKTAVRSSTTEDLSKAITSVCFLAIGVHKVHLIPLFKPPSQRSSSPALVSYGANAAYGILNMTELRISETDDTFELTFR